MKWLFDKIVGSLALIALAPIMLARRHRHQARQPRPGAVQAEALRLQQRADRNLQIPLDVCRSGRRHRRASWSPGRPAGDPRRPLHPQDQPRRIAAALQRRVRRQSVAGRAAPARRARQGRRTASTTRRSTAISPATASSPASPAGRRSTAGAARPTARKRSSAASSTTSTTSRTGRSCSTSTSCANAVRAAPHGECVLSALRRSQRSPAARLFRRGRGTAAAAVERRPVRHGADQLDRLHRAVAARRLDDRAAGHVRRRARAVRPQARSAGVAAGDLAGRRLSVADPGRRSAARPSNMSARRSIWRLPRSCSPACSATAIWCG